MLGMSAMRLPVVGEDQFLECGALRYFDGLKKRGQDQKSGLFLPRVAGIHEKAAENISLGFRADPAQ